MRRHGAVTDVRWSQLPLPTRPPPARRGLHPVLEAALAWSASGLGPVLWVRTSTRYERVWWVVAVTVVGAVAATAWLRRRRRAAAPPWHEVALVCGTIAVAAGIAGGPGTAVWSAAGGLVAGWIVHDSPPPWCRRVEAAARPAAVGAVVAAVVATTQWIDHHALVGFGTPVLVVAIAAAASWCPAPFVAVGRAVPAAARRLAATTTTVLTAAVGTVLLVGPWALLLIVRWDPTWVPRRDASSWVGRVPYASDDRRMWAPDQRLRRTTARRRLHRLVAVVATVGAVGAVVGGVAWRRQHDAERALYGSPALASSSWWPRVADAMNVAYSRADVTSYLGVVMPDVASPDFNISGGRRATWQPPNPPECRPLRVWILGGSTVFGEGQRDGRTIASSLARAAWDDGRAWRVENLGVPGDTHWMEVRRLEVELASGATPPDLAVFYDGANDLRAQVSLEAVGLGGSRLFANDLDTQVLLDLERRNRRAADLFEIIRDGPTVMEQSRARLDPEQVGAFAARGYAAAGRTGQLLLAANGVERAWFHQPTRVTRRPAVEGDGPSGDDERRAEGAFRRRLPPEVTDLAGALDASSGAVYWDAVHMNEAGAEVVGRTMYRHLRDTIATPRLEESECG